MFRCILVPPCLVCRPASCASCSWLRASGVCSSVRCLPCTCNRVRILSSGYRMIMATTPSTRAETDTDTNTECTERQRQTTTCNMQPASRGHKWTHARDTCTRTHAYAHALHSLYMCTAHALYDMHMHFMTCTYISKQPHCACKHALHTFKHARNGNGKRKLNNFSFSFHLSSFMHISALCIVHSAFCILYCILHCAFCIVHSASFILRCALCVVMSQSLTRTASYEHVTTTNTNTLTLIWNMNMKSR